MGATYLKLEDFYEKTGFCIFCGEKIFTRRAKYYCSLECRNHFPHLEACLVKKYGKTVPQMIEWAVSQTKTDYEAAKLLDISRSHFSNLKKKYFGLDSDFSLRERLEMKHGKPIRQVLTTALNSHPTKKETADFLGISKACLQNWMDRHDIQQITYFE